MGGALGLRAAGCEPVGGGLSCAAREQPATVGVGPARTVGGVLWGPRGARTANGRGVRSPGSGTRLEPSTADRPHLAWLYSFSDSSDAEEFHMKKILTQYEVCALAAALLATDGAGAAGRNAGRLRKSAGALSDKFTGLARIRSGKYDWKPGQGVRSVADVFNLIVMEHAVLVGV